MELLLAGGTGLSEIPSENSELDKPQKTKL